MLRSLENVPTVVDAYLVADYVEFRALVAGDGSFTAEELEEARKRQRDIGKARRAGLRDAVAAAATPEGDEPSERLPDSDPEDDELPAGLDESIAEAAEQAAEDEDGHDEGRSAPARADDARDLESREVFALIGQRGEAFGEDYPFTLDGGEVLTIRDELSDHQRLYAFLLIASSLNRLAEAHKAPLTTHFERMSAEVVSAYLDSGRVEVHVFGTATAPGERYHGGSLADRLARLAGDLRLPLKATPAQLGASGDRGLDLVGWFPVPEGDRAPTMLTLFAQCATGKDWLDKQSEASEQEWQGVFDFDSPLVTMLMVPYCYRDRAGLWFNPSRLARNVVFDRLRTVLALRGRPLPLPGFPADLVNEVLAQSVEPAG